MTETPNLSKMLKQTLLKLTKFNRINSLYCSVYHKNVTISSYQTRKFHLSKKHTHQRRNLENHYMYQVLFKPVPPFSQTDLGIEEVKTLHEFEDVLTKDYRINSGHSATDVVNAFKVVQNYCSINEINLSDKVFDNLVDGLMDHAEALTNDELLELLLCIAKYPRCQSYRDHNYHDIWSCLNDISCEKLHETDLEYQLKLAEAWYKLDLGKIGDYIFSMMDIWIKRANKLNKDQIVKLFFLTNICRRKSVPFEFEEALEKYVKQLTVDELGIVALGYFKSMSKVKLPSITLAMMEAVKREKSNLNQISLAAILKVLRFTKLGPQIPELNTMLDELLDQIDRLSPQCCLHIATIGTGHIFLHKSTMDKAAQKIVNLMGDVKQVRLKDIERIINAATMCDYRPNVVPDLFEISFQEIHKEQRKSEMALYPKILPCILNYLSIVNMYSYDLMDRVLDMDYILQTYGKGIGAIPREIFLLDSCIDLECPDYKGTRLSPNIKYRLVKWTLEFTPTYNQYTNLTAYDKLYLDIVDRIKSIIGDEKAVRPDHVLPHFPRADIILCKDKKTNRFIEPPGFQRYVLGDTKYAMEDENLAWYAITVVGWNNTIRSTSLPVGMVVMKQRQLRKLGYNSKLIVWNRYMPLSNELKVKFLKSLLQ